jgi:methylene-tetrahydromethanopterin dehydrogenase
MERPYILHMFTPERRLSPFDVNMAADAGWQLVVPYGEVGENDVAAMTQDTIFSRGPKGAKRSGIFIGGRDALLATTMLEAARKAMVPPFVVSLMADPSGAYTTAAALLASVEKALGETSLKGLQVLVLGGTGPLGRIAGVLAAQAGAQVTLAGRHGGDAAARETTERFGAALAGGRSDDRALLARAQVVLACASAGVQVLSAADLAHAKALRVAADVNAVPPAGIEGVGVMDDAKPLAGTQAVGIGALAIGNVKYQTQQRLLQRMREATEPVCFGVAEAFAVAREVVGAAAR